jgi:hypothetical protein
LFEPSSYIHAVAQEIGPLHDHVANIDANAKSDLLIGRQLIVPCVERRLDLSRATDSFHSTIEFREDRISCGVENAPVMRGHKRFENLFAFDEMA